MFFKHNSGAFELCWTRGGKEGTLLIIRRFLRGQVGGGLIEAFSYVRRG